MAKKMTMTKYENSNADKKIDKAKGYKEGSAKDNAADRAAVRKANKGRK